MTTYRPKAARPVTAARATEDLLVESGSWLTIDADGSIAHLTDAEFRAVYDVDDEQRARSSESRAPRTNEAHALYKQDEVTDSALKNGAAGRVLYALRLLERPATTAEVAALLPASDGKSVSPRLGNLVYAGYARKAPSVSRLTHYAITKSGVAASRRVGTQAFTKYSHSVPLPPNKTPLEVAAAASAEHV